MMSDYPSKVKWAKENFLMVSIKFHRKKETDLVAFLESKGSEKNSYIKQALAEYIKNHPEEK